jgi:hypothetical protein
LFKRLSKALRYSIVLLNGGLRPAWRVLLRRMIGFSRALPRQFDRPLPEMMNRLTPNWADDEIGGQTSALVSVAEVRELADAVAAWHFRSPLGICLRRSLLRYHFLRRAGVPVQIIFGARFKDRQEGGGLGGHAWLTLHGVPYYEDPADCKGFVEMVRYPAKAADTPEIHDVRPT